MRLEISRLPSIPWTVRLCGKHSTPPELLNSWFSSSRICTPAHHEFESEWSCRKHLTLPRVCAKDMFLPLHYSVWQSTGSCPDVPAVSALLSESRWSSVHRPKLRRRRGAIRTRSRKVAGRTQTFRRCCNHHGSVHLVGKDKTAEHRSGPPPQSVSVDAVDGHSVEVKFVYLGSTVVLTPLATPVLIFFDDSDLHLQWWAS